MVTVFRVGQLAASLTYASSALPSPKKNDLVDRCHRQMFLPTKTNRNLSYRNYKLSINVFRPTTDAYSFLYVHLTYCLPHKKININIKWNEKFT